MKFYLLTPLVLILSLFGPVTPAQAGQITIQNVDIMTWPTNLQAAKALDIFIGIMNSDLEVSSILNQVNTKLQAHGVNSFSEIFNYCEGEPPAPGATAFFRQNSNIVETRISIPGLPENPWSDSVLEKQKSAFSSKVIKTPFIEFLALSERPEICIHQGKQLFSAYVSVVHEMTHFLMKDPFSFYDELLSSQPFPDFVSMTVTEVGGELDAFKIGSSATIRFLKKYSIQGYSSESHQFFNNDGLLTDADGLKTI